MNKNKRRLGGAVYILPNLLTTGNLYFGFFSIVKSIHGDYSWASVAIFLAAIFDVLDGRVARLTNSNSEFGVQYDSLCDLVSFGLAPAFLMYQFALNGEGRVGWIFCFIFVACGALRLARFNVQTSIGQNSGDFTGLPIPMAAGLIASFISLQVYLTGKHIDSHWLLQEIQHFLIKDQVIIIFLLIFAPLLAFLMVSNIRFRSHKTINVKLIKPFRLLALLVVIVGLSAIYPEVAGFLFFLFYVLFGVFEWVIGWKKASEEHEIFTPINENNSVMEPSSNDKEE